MALLARGLRIGQLRTQRKGKIAHNACWYNQLGEMFGYGDLASDDISIIAAGLEDNERFIVCDAFHLTDLSEIAKRCKYIITPGQAYYVVATAYPERRELFHQGVHYKVLTLDEARKFIGSSQVTSQV